MSRLLKISSTILGLTVLGALAHYVVIGGVVYALGASATTALMAKGVTWGVLGTLGMKSVVKQVKSTVKQAIVSDGQGNKNLEKLEEQRNVRVARFSGRRPKRSKIDHRELAHNCKTR